MTPWQLLAYLATFWVLVLATGWVVFVMLTRTKAIDASISLKQRAIDKRQRAEDAALGAMAEGRGPIPGDADEAAIEERAIKRTRGY